MNRLIGLYIEDDQKNIAVIRELFRQEGLKIVSLKSLPSRAEDLYPQILSMQVDFLLIDHELNKAVSYTGFDALQEIRKNDRTIYAVLITNFSLDDYKDEFSEYDYQVRKSELGDDKKISEIVAKIRRACERIEDSALLAQMERQEEARREALDRLRDIRAAIIKERTE